MTSELSTRALIQQLGMIFDKYPSITADVTHRRAQVMRNRIGSRLKTLIGSLEDFSPLLDPLP